MGMLNCTTDEAAARAVSDAVAGGMRPLMDKQCVCGHAMCRPARARVGSATALLVSVASRTVRQIGCRYAGLLRRRGLACGAERWRLLALAAVGGGHAVRPEEVRRRRARRRRELGGNMGAACQHLARDQLKTPRRAGRRWRMRLR